MSVFFSPPDLNQFRVITNKSDTISSAQTIRARCPDGNRPPLHLIFQHFLLRIFAFFCPSRSIFADPHLNGSRKCKCRRGGRGVTVILEYAHFCHKSSDTSGAQQCRLCSFSCGSVRGIAACWIHLIEYVPRFQYKREPSLALRAGPNQACIQIRQRTKAL